MWLSESFPLITSSYRFRFVKWNWGRTSWLWRKQPLQHSPNKRAVVDCLLKDALEGMVNGKTVRGKRRYQMIDSIMINGLYEYTKRKAEKRVEWRMLSLQLKTCPWAEHYDWWLIVTYMQFGTLYYWCTTYRMWPFQCVDWVSPVLN